MKRKLELLIGGLLLFSASSVLAQTGAPPLSFGQPTISGIQGVGFEQDLRLDPTSANRVYTSVPGSLSSDTSWIWKSKDGGKTFKWVTASLPKTGKINVCAGGGDTELAVDTGGNLFFNDLTLANFSTARSEDTGSTFLCSNTGVPDAAVDRQWYAVDGNPTTGTGLGNGAGHNIYLANDEIGPGAVTCAVSGLVNNVLAMYRSPTPAGGLGTGGIEFGPGYKVTRPLSCDEGIMGNNEVSPVATATGKLDPKTNQPVTLPEPVKHVYVIHDDATFSKIAIGRCFPVAFGPPISNVSDPSGLNCDDLPVASFPGFKTGGNFPSLAIDRAGNLYAVWEQAPVDATTGQITGDTVLRYSFSTNEGTTWSAPITIPTPGLRNNVFAWAAAGDSGRVDIAWYGTPAPANPDDPTCGTNHGGKGGPDATTNGIWSLYLMQTLNGNSSAPAFTAPVLAGEHAIHKGTIQTVLGGQCGDRTLGDFLQLRIGSKGEAQISYADSNNADAAFAPHGMYVKQNGGTGVFASAPSVSGDPILLNATSDPSGDGRRETAGVTGPNDPNLDILQSSISQPAPADCHPAGTPCYRVKTTVNNLTLAPPAPDTVAVWLTQWLVPAAACTSTAPSCKNGGKNPFVYFESNKTCWSGENAALLLGGGVTLTYPGTKQIVAPGACSFTLGSLGTITIDVPIADVSLDPGVAPLSNRLFSVTASTMTLNAPPESAPPNPGGFKVFSGPIGGVLFDLIDVVRAYDFVPGAGGGGGGGCHKGVGDGHVPGERSGAASFHFSAASCPDGTPESVDEKDPASNMDFHSTQFLSVAFDTVARTVTIVGTGTDNGIPVTFTAVGVDNGTTALDMFSLTLSDGYTNAGNLLDGYVTIY
jgi:hypothetical protein